MTKIKSSRVKNKEEKAEDVGILSFDDVTSMFVFFMRIHALLPLKGRRFDYLPTRGLLYFFLTSSFISCSMLICHCIREKIVTVDAVCEMMLVFGLNVRYYLLIIRRQEYADLLDECRSIWNECDVHERHTVIVFTRKMQGLFYLFVSSGIVLTLLYTVTALTGSIPADESNGRERRILPYKWYVDNPEDHWPGYTMSFLIQSLVVCNAGSYSTITDTAVPLLIMFCCGFLRSASDRFYQAGLSYVDDFNGQSLFAHCSKFHQRVLNLCARLKKLSSSIFFMQIFCAAYNTSLLGIKLMGTDSDRYKYLPMLLTSLGQLFVCQWPPDYLIDESLQVAMAAYFAAFGWMRRRVGKLLVIVIARAQKPVQMTAGGFIHLSLESYGHIITNAFSFFMLLRNLNL